MNFYKRLEVYKTLNSPNRNSSIDLYRSLAIIAVVAFHFNHQIYYGYLGVDLFFVISGLLVGGILTKEFESGVKINFLKFFLQRGFKIWPSYYAFIFLGTLFALCFYRTSNPNQIIPLWDMKRYLFFYQNYTGPPFHFSFDHVWSLCVEEHFYILLPILFISIQYLVKDKYKTVAIFASVCMAIIAGIVFKYISYYYTHSKDTYSATHNRIDALAWGVLLNLIITHFGGKIKSSKLSPFIAIIGFILFIATIYYKVNFAGVLFGKIYMHSIIPFAFFLILLGSYYIDFSKLSLLRFIAYYSYNWYLWHSLFDIYITKHVGNNWLGLSIYFVVTFVVAMTATILIEETFLKKRNAVLAKIFPRTSTT